MTVSSSPSVLLASSWTSFPIIDMSYSIRFDIPSPPEGAPFDAVPRLLLAIRHLVVDRFDGSMLVANVTLPPRGDRPASPGFRVTLDFEDSVNPLAVTRALDEIFDHIEEIALSVPSTK